MRIVRRRELAILILSLLSTFVFIQRLNVPCVKASPDMHQGDLVLTGNNVTTIENQRFDINGSIIVEENATLILKDVILNFTQNESQQLDMIMQNPVNGNPRLMIENATITSNYHVHVKSYANSSIISDKLFSNPYIRFRAYDSSNIHLAHSNLYSLYGYSTSVIVTSNSSFSYLVGEDDSHVSASNCTLETLSGRDNTTCIVTDSTITQDVISYASSINCSIHQLQSDIVSYWNFRSNSSIKVALGGWAPNITLINTEVNRWSFTLGGDSNATISNCKLQRLRADDSAVILVYNSTNFGWIAGKGNSCCYLYDTSIDMLEAHDNATLWLMNSTYNSPAQYSSGRIYVSWYLDVHVVDQIGQNVPFANVTSKYPNGTLAVSELTDADGWTRFSLREKMMNATGEHPIGNYTVEATYEIYSDATIVNMTGNQQAILALEDLVIPEFPSLLILPLFLFVSLLTALICKGRKRKARLHSYASA